MAQELHSYLWNECDFIYEISMIYAGYDSLLKLKSLENDVGVVSMMVTNTPCLPELSAGLLSGYQHDNIEVTPLWSILQAWSAF